MPRIDVSQWKLDTRYRVCKTGIKSRSAARGDFGSSRSRKSCRLGAPDETSAVAPSSRMPHPPLLFLAPLPLASATSEDFTDMRGKRFQRGVSKNSRSQNRGGQKFYAVRRGRDGFRGVLTSWADCQPHVAGVASAVYKSFATHNEALAFSQPLPGEPSEPAPTSSKRRRVQKFYAVRNGLDGFCGVVNTWDECSLYVTGVSGVKFKRFETYEEAEAFVREVPEAPANAPIRGSASRAVDDKPVVFPEVQMAPVAFPEVQMAPVRVLPEAARQQMRLVVYTDGACQNNGRANSKAGYGVFFGEHSPFNISEPLQGQATNQRAEMTAVLAAMHTVIANDLVIRAGTLEIRTDSQYTKNGIEKWVDGWKNKDWKTVHGEKVKNKDLWMALDAAKYNLMLGCVDLKLVWVKGHVGNPGNEAADRLAVHGIWKT